jgi:hypothetical protein
VFLLDNLVKVVTAIAAALVIVDRVLGSLESDSDRCRVHRSRAADLLYEMNYLHAMTLQTFGSRFREPSALFEYYEGPDERALALLLDNLRILGDRTSRVLLWLEATLGRQIPPDDLLHLRRSIAEISYWIGLTMQRRVVGPQHASEVRRIVFELESSADPLRRNALRAVASAQRYLSSVQPLEICGP